jgi:Holliday junction resolvase RusA-like endonuclease
MFKPKKTRLAQEKLQWELKCAAPNLRSNAIARFGVQLVFRTNSFRKDGDNCEKLVLDAFLKMIRDDDSQIADRRVPVEDGPSFRRRG